MSDSRRAMSDGDHPGEPGHRHDAERAQSRRRRILNNLPLAHRLAAVRASASGVSSLGPSANGASARLLGQALIGLVAAADSYDEHAAERFSAFAEPRILSALDRACGDAEIASAQREVAAVISSQRRVRELADFLDVPVQALVGGLMDGACREPGVDPTHPLCGRAHDRPDGGARRSDDVLRVKSRVFSYRSS